MTDDDPTHEFAGRGGGPPGGSAFTRDGKIRQPISPRFVPSDPAFTPVETPSTPPSPPSSPTRPRSPDPTSVSERSFPGGHVSLPHLSGSSTQTLFVSGAAFLPTSQPSPIAGNENTRSGFTDYYSTDSLFAPPEVDVEAGDGVADDVRRACSQLRVRPDTPWSEVVARHRALVKTFHPDAFTDHDETTRALAEEEIRKINQAYDVLRRRPLRQPTDLPDHSSRPPSAP